MDTVNGVLLFGSYLTDFLYGIDNNYAGKKLFSHVLCLYIAKK